MFEAYQKEVEFAVQAVTIAARLCRKIQKEMILDAVSKKDQSPVTVADFASQAVVARMMMEAFPKFTLVGEEDSSLLKTKRQEQNLASVLSYVQSIFPEALEASVSEWIDQGAGEVRQKYWTLDPIDGTKGFLRGDQYAVALGLVVKGQVILGALGCPTLNEDFMPDVGSKGMVLLAVRGEGAWAKRMEGERFRQVNVSDCGVPSEARLLRSFESEHTDVEKMEQLIHVMGITAQPVLMDSSAKYALLAAGKGDLIIRLVTPFRPDYTEKIWDHAAGSLIVEEAGGRVTDLRGGALDFSRGRLLECNIGVVASNGFLHEAVLEALERVGANRRPQAL